MSIVRYSVLCLLALLFFSCDENKEYTGEPLVFIGDSLIEGWNTKRHFPSHQTTNKGVSGARIEDTFTWNIDATSQTAIFLIGTNNLGGVSFIPESFYAEFVDSYLELIALAGAKRNIVISILPRIPAAHRPTINQEIIRLNAELKAAFADHSHILFLDIYDAFSDGQQSANPVYFYDGLHLDDKGYELLSAELSKFL